ncbi:MerR family transcriptional regulator [Neobacillus pocheonensis]|uniref:MerR family transcriptional regulator n=1 Tax=Neobacillus pocheonensis TaxID=363869 RepID=A0ABT0WCI8_9BACI|nr:MerR family transcriptional regulator [Neobacillus pocheonensis]
MVSKRTIDYYTSIGLLSAERSKSNYRIYSDESLKDLKYIEECKSLHYPLDEIRRKLDMRKAKKILDSEVENHVQAVTQQMKQLQNELSALEPLLAKIDLLQKEMLASNFNKHRNALVKSLLNLTS